MMEGTKGGKWRREEGPIGMVWCLGCGGGIIVMVMIK